MTTLDMLFTISIIPLLVTWGWFIILGFQANKVWGFSIIFLSPVTPFMFASRFARKARGVFYYYIASIVIFVVATLYIQFVSVDFYPNLLKKITFEEIVTIDNKVESDTTVFSTDEVDETDETEDEVTLEPEITEEIVETAPEVIKKSKPSYKPINIGEAHRYLDKKIIIYTSIKKHKGRLMSVTGSELVVKKFIGRGKVLMPIEKSKIVKVEIYK